MKKAEFEQAVMQWWAQTRIPLTLANVALLSGQPRKRVASWLDELTAESILNVDADEEGNLVYSVSGVARTPTGLTTYAEYAKLLEFKRDASRSPGALVSNLAAGGLMRPTPASKNLAVAGLLAFFFGPLGLFYAAPMSEALLALVVWVVAGIFLPPLGLVVHLALAGLSVWYAVQYNNRGQRAALLAGRAKPRALPPY